MKKVTAILLALCMVVSLAACGSSASTDPNAGTYTATTGSAFGIEISVADFFGEGFIIELKDNGKCSMTVDGESAKGTWTLDGTAFTVDGGGLNASGTLENGVIILENVMDSGVDLTLERDAAAE